MGFTRTPLGDSDFYLQTLYKDRFVIALPVDHARVKQPKLRLRDFADDGFILFSRAQGAAIYDGIIASCAQAGFNPRVAQEGSGVQTILALVAAGLGVALVPAALRHMQRPGVIYRELPATDTKETELSLVWRKDDRSPLVEAFVKVAREAARDFTG